MLSFFPRGVLDEILNIIESVSEDFPSYSCIRIPFIYQCQISFKRLVWIYKNANIVQLKNDLKL